MELQALLNRRQPRKRPARRQTVDLVSSDSEPEQDDHRCQLPQPQGFKMESTLWSQKKVMRQELYPGTSRANWMWFTVRPEYPVPKTTEEMSPGPQTQNQTQNNYLSLSISFSGCGPSHCWSDAPYFLGRISWSNGSVCWWQVIYGRWYQYNYSILL
jgi:hypothetical protein